MALQEHFADAGHAAEVAVDLKRGMCVEKIGIRSLRAEQEAQDRVRVIPFQKTCPQVEAPGDAPAGGVVTTNLQRFARGRRQLGRLLECDLTAREKTVEVRDVPVVDLRCREVPIFEPLLQLTGGAD